MTGEPFTSTQRKMSSFKSRQCSRRRLYRALSGSEHRSEPVDYTDNYSVQFTLVVATLMDGRLVVMNGEAAIAYTAKLIWSDEVNHAHDVVIVTEFRSLP